MKPRTLIIAFLILLSACSTSTAPAPQPADSGAPSSISTTGPAHTPLWIAVKYRSDPVDVADPRFTALTRTDSSLVDAAFYDAGNEYMIIVLNGTPYHYCGMPRGVWTSFVTSDSLGSYYRSRIKGNFDCRTGFVPEY